MHKKRRQVVFHDEDPAKSLDLSPSLCAAICVPLERDSPGEESCGFEVLRMGIVVRICGLCSKAACRKAGATTQVSICTFPLHINVTTQLREFHLTTLRRSPQSVEPVCIFKPILLPWSEEKFVVVKFLNTYID
jgi:hypothetical protein